jgi:hypothetical protein
MRCIHDKEKTRCPDCNGPGEGSFCEHSIIRGTCSLCEPEQSFKRCARSAQERGIRFELSLSQFKQIVFQPCHYCNAYGVPRGIDRRNNRDFYSVANSVAACGRCNRWKSDESPDVFLGHARKIFEHQQKLKLKSQIDPGALTPGPVLSVDKQSVVVRSEP